MCNNVGKSLAYRAIGPITKYCRKFSFVLFGKCPFNDTTPAVGLWPKIPLNIAGTRIDPAMSEPTPNNDAPAPISAPFKVKLIQFNIFFFFIFYKII